MSPAARREQLVQAALRTFALLGIGEASHTALAAEAGVAVPTTFHYFPSRQALTDAVLEEVSRFLIEDLLESNTDESVSAPQSIEAILLAFCDSIDTNPDYARVWLQWSVSIRSDLWQSYLVFYNRATSGIRRILERGIGESSITNDLDIDDAARVIVGLAHMVAHMKFSGSSRARVVRTVHSLAQGYMGDNRNQHDRR
jgi:TetR/AcrR family hemagglutinin/protease transcriptional regulator